jgi:asparaginyl-tRNA synthetase
MFSSALRMRHAMAFATHKFFNERGFVYTHTPLITGSDCEGAGEQFTVTSLLPDNVLLKDIPVDKNGKVDFSKDFFSKKCSMTVSGQLNVETHACALSDVYTFGPTFRAENSHTARHLAEFWMIEPEICFATLADDMALAEDYVRYCSKYALENCADDLYYFEHEYPQGEKGLTARLQNVVESDFAQITYTEAVQLLQKEIASGAVQFERYPNWGDDLGSEHERYITEKIFKKPTIVINYPKGIKAFYMKLNDDNETVAAMDILVPKIGELIGGSQREDNLDVLVTRCKAMGLHPEDLWWYLDLRRYGSVPHAGFGLGFERLIMFVTGLENIRDVISFPRVPGHADF